jgi:hypothetical protein
MTGSLTERRKQGSGIENTRQNSTERRHKAGAGADPICSAYRATFLAACILLIRKIINSISVACWGSIINCKLVSIPSPGIFLHATFSVQSNSICKKVNPIPSVACRQLIIMYEYAPAPSGILRHATSSPLSDYRMKHIPSVACRKFNAMKCKYALAPSGILRRATFPPLSDYRMKHISSVACRNFNALICNYALAPSGILRHATSSPLYCSCGFDAGAIRRVADSDDKDYTYYISSRVGNPLQNIV